MGEGWRGLMLSMCVYTLVIILLIHDHYRERGRFREEGTGGGG